MFVSLCDLAANPAHRCAPDEPAWITTSYLTFRLVADGASLADWTSAYDEAGLGSYGNVNPPVGKWMTGAIVALFRDPTQPVDYVWEWPGSYVENQQRGNIPPDSLLVPVRQGMALLATLTLALVYVCALQVTGTRWLSLLAPIVLFLSPIFRLHGAQVYMDIPQLLWLALAVVAFNDFLHAERRTSFVVALVAMGLACAVKFSAAPIVLASAAFLALRAQSLSMRIRQTALALVLPFAVFCAVNPYLWVEPQLRVPALLSEWSQIKSGQKHDPALAASAVHSPAEGLAALTRDTVTHAGLDHPILWRLPLSPLPLWLGSVALLAIAMLRFRFALPPWSPRLRLFALAAVGLLPGLWAIGAVGLSAPAIALGCLALFAPRGEEDGHDAVASRFCSPAGYVALCALCMLAVSGLWLPFRWGRYALPTLLLLPSFYVAAAALLVEIAGRRAPRSRAAASDRVLVPEESG